MFARRTCPKVRSLTFLYVLLRCLPNFLSRTALYIQLQRDINKKKKQHIQELRFLHSALHLHVMLEFYDRVNIVKVMSSRQVNHLSLFLGRLSHKANRLIYSTSTVWRFELDPHLLESHVSLRIEHYFVYGMFTQCIQSDCLRLYIGYSTNKQYNQQKSFPWSFL